MRKIWRVKQKTEEIFKSENTLVNNANTGISLWTVNNESKNDNLNIHDQSGGGITLATATLAKSNNTFSVSQTPSVSSSKVEDIEEDLPKRKESISGNWIIVIDV